MRRFTGRRWAAIAAAAASVCINISAHAQINTVWQGGSSSWYGAGNWTNGIPNNNGSIHFNAFIDGGVGGSSICSLLSGPGSSTTIDNLTISSGDHLRIGGAHTLFLVGNGTTCNHSNAGTIQINSQLILNSTNCTINGGGTITLQDNAAKLFGTGRFTNVNNLIQGFGYIGWAGAAPSGWTNNATISANASGATLTCDSAPSEPFINNGLMHATNQGILFLQNSQFDNTLGTIRADAASFVSLSNSTVIGGVLTTSGSGEIISTGSGTISNLTMGGMFVVQGQLHMAGTINNTGIFFCDDGHRFEIDAGTVTLTGGGFINMIDAGGEFRGGDTIVNVNNTIHGLGEIGNNSGFVSLINQSQGLVDADLNGSTLTIAPGTQNGVVNSGMLRARNGGILKLSTGGGSFTNNGTILAQNNSRVQLGEGVIIAGGTLATSGTGAIRNDAANVTLRALFLSGHFLNNSGNTNLDGTIINLGSIDLNGSGFSRLVVAADNSATLTGGGSINMIQNAVIEGDGTLLNNNNTIQGLGSIGGGTLRMVNQGTIIATGGAMVFDPDERNFINNGLLESDAGATLSFVGAVGTFGGSGAIAPNGTLSLSSVAIASTGDIDGAGTVTLAFDCSLLANHLRVKHVSIGTGATLTIATNGSDSGTSRLVNNPVIDGRFNLTDNDLIVTAGTLSTIVSQIVSARNGGDWDQPGLTSSAALAAGNTTLAAITGQQFHAAQGGGALFDGFTVANTDVLVKYTYYGDANFNGKVDGSDYAAIDTSFNNQITQGNIGGWINGDFDYNGKVDGTDYALIDGAFNSQNGTLRSRVIVPEPVAVAWVAGLAGLLRSRRTRF